MLQLSNDTPFEAELLPLPDREGIDTLFTLVKGTFVLSRGCAIADEQAPVVLEDAYHGEPGKSSIRTPSDVCLDKPGTDVLLIGSAWAPNGEPAWQVDVSLAIGPVRKVVRVFGDRVWKTGAAGASMSWVAPFVRMPLVWERAFGGSDETNKGPTADARNPVGAGFRARHGMKPLNGMPLPNIENPSSLITSPADTPLPAAFAPVAANWQPRVAYAGTYDDAWQSSRAPYLPLDFDTRFFQLAPADLITPAPLLGGEAVEVRGASPDGVLHSRLPAVQLEVRHQMAGGEQTVPAVLDTVIVEPDADRLIMVWRTGLRCDKQIRKVQEVTPVLLSVS